VALAALFSGAWVAPRSFSARRYYTLVFFILNIWIWGGFGVTQAGNDARAAKHAAKHAAAPFKMPFKMPF